VRSGRGRDRPVRPLARRRPTRSACGEACRRVPPVHVRPDRGGHLDAIHAERPGTSTTARPTARTSSSNQFSYDTANQVLDGECGFSRRATPTARVRNDAQLLRPRDRARFEQPQDTATGRRRSTRCSRSASAAGADRRRHGRAHAAGRSQLPDSSLAPGSDAQSLCVLDNYASGSPTAPFRGRTPPADPASR